MGVTVPPATARIRRYGNRRSLRRECGERRQPRTPAVGRADRTCHTVSAVAQAPELLVHQADSRLVTLGGELHRDPRRLLDVRLELPGAGDHPGKAEACRRIPVGDLAPCRFAAVLTSIEH